MNSSQSNLILSVGIVLGQTKIRFATVAPEGSTWMKVMKQYTKAVEDATNNEIEFKVYPGQVAGDEKDVLRKIRIGQLDSGGFTGVGLGEILPEVRIMDSPFLFKSYEEIDYIAEQFFDYFSEKFEEKEQFNITLRLVDVYTDENLTVFFVSSAMA